MLMSKLKIAKHKLRKANEKEVGPGIEPDLSWRSGASWFDFLVPVPRRQLAVFSQTVRGGRFRVRLKIISVFLKISLFKFNKNILKPQVFPSKEKII